MGERGSKSVSAQASVPHSASLEPDGGVRKIKPISIRDAIDVRRQGGDVVVSGGDMASNRELARMIDSSSSLIAPALRSFKCGMSVPSSKDELALADIPTPPTSMTWQVEAKIATGLLLRKTGVIIT